MLGQLPRRGRRNYLLHFDEATALKFLRNPKTSKEVRNLAFYFTADEFPKHRMLQKFLMLAPMGTERDQIMEIATGWGLLSWRAELSPIRPEILFQWFL